MSSTDTAFRVADEAASSGFTLIRVSIPTRNIQKCLRVNEEDTAWNVKQHVLSSLVGQEMPESFNLGLFIPAANGRAGKFLDDERPLKDYSLPGQVPFLELKYKKRLYKEEISPKRLKQVQTKSSLRKLMEAVRRNDINKVARLTKRGLDPNFIDTKSGETPLTLAIELNNPKSMILTLLQGGSLLDFRNWSGRTPVHRSAELGKISSLQTLFDLGMSANYKDVNGLTPLYVCITNSAVGAVTSQRCIEMLLYDHAILGTADSAGWTELHQACQVGRMQAVDQLIYYGADVNCTNAVGNTPLHICAFHNQEECARILMFRGANRTIINRFGESAYQLAVNVGNTQLANVLSSFSIDDIVLYRDMPPYNPRRRSCWLSKMSASRDSSYKRPQQSQDEQSSDKINGYHQHQQPILQAVHQRAFISNDIDQWNVQQSSDSAGTRQLGDGESAQPNVTPTNRVSSLRNLTQLIQNYQIQSNVNTEASSSSVDGKFVSDHVMSDRKGSVRDDVHQTTLSDGNKIASIRSVHGKRMTSSVPLASVFKESISGRFNQSDIRQNQYNSTVSSNLPTVADRSQSALHGVLAAVDVHGEVSSFNSDNLERKNSRTRSLNSDLTRSTGRLNLSAVEGDDEKNSASMHNLLLSDDDDSVVKSYRPTSESNVISTGSHNEAVPISYSTTSQFFSYDHRQSSDSKVTPSKAVMRDNFRDNVTSLRHPPNTGTVVSVVGPRPRPLPPNRKPPLPEHLRRQLNTDGRLQHQLRMTSSVYESPSSAVNATPSMSPPVSNIIQISSVRYSRRRRVTNQSLAEEKLQTSGTAVDRYHSLLPTSGSSLLFNSQRQSTTERHAASGGFDVGTAERVKIVVGNCSSVGGNATSGTVPSFSQSSLIDGWGSSADDDVFSDTTAGRRSSVSSFYNGNQNWKFNIEPSVGGGSTSSCRPIEQRAILLNLLDISQTIPPPPAFSDNVCSADDVTQKQEPVPFMDLNSGSVVNGRAISEKLVTQNPPVERKHVSRLELI